MNLLIHDGIKLQLSMQNLISIHCSFVLYFIDNQPTNIAQADSPNMKMFVSILIISMHASSVMSVITKRRLCLSYRMESSHGDHNITSRTVAHGESWCMRKCIRHPDCWAFNYFQNGTCEFLPVLGDCDEPHSQAGSTFVHLSTCTGEMPINHTRNWTSDACLTWIPHNKGLPKPRGMLMGTDGKLCLSLVHFHGLYIPGWFRRGIFRLVRQDQEIQKCPAGYVAKLASGCTITWQNYTAGQPVPQNALQISVWRDGTPLYAVEFLRRNTYYYIGYYLPTAQRVFIMASRVINPVHVRMLVLNWELNITHSKWKQNS